MSPHMKMEGKQAHDPHHHHHQAVAPIVGVRRVWVPGPVIVGAGPSGLAVAACLKDRGIPRLILDRANCIGSLWQQRTYDRLHLHLPKQFCQLPLLPFPRAFPKYPSKQHFITYLESYANHFNLGPALGRAVAEAQYDPRNGLWRVRTSGPKKAGSGTGEGEVEYLCHWLVVATGENAEPFVPQIEGREDFEGPVFHSSEYKRGDEFKGKRVLVVGCGNSGMEVCLDLCNHNAFPSLVVRDSVHVLPQKMLGTSTFGLSTYMMKWLPIKLVDQFLLLMSRLILGNTTALGIARPTMGPFEYKNVLGKTPVLDIGTIAKIKSGDIQKDGYPVKPFPDGWKGENGLYAVGFTKRGLLGTSHDATRIAEDIERDWKTSKAIDQASNI
ncbi:hypothetical protein Cgig2_018714 [Carnegiea gigantea]|uniref:indole-3-pyruvate monooxygenase n=1 Tax=Carnegiea gigantea TaxID=171969 RepID=A0A9Q1QHJ5_9CARY|nr:hypothetical protein Cgig2_018714 [Carnegiea gigantea]